MAKLNDLQCKNATNVNAKGVAVKINKLNDGDGLALWVDAAGSKYWRFKYVVHGKEKLLSLGVYPKVSLAKAREKAKALSDQLVDGLDPSQERRKKELHDRLSAASTFKAVADEWYAKQVPTWAASHAVDVRRRLDKDLFPRLGKRPIADLSAPEILDCIRLIEARGKHDLSHRVLGVCGQVLRYGIASHRGTVDHTMNLRGSLTKHEARPQHAVPAKDLPQLLRDIASYEQPPINGEHQTRLALQVLAYTFVRTSELINATWDELDLDAPYNAAKGTGPMWCIPASRMKLKKELMVPLAPQTVAIFRELKAMAGDSEWVLPGRSGLRPISNNTLLFALYRLGYRGKMTGHGFRAIASTALNESNLFQSAWIERQLAHVPASEVEGVYNRALYLPKRAQMMRWWATYLDSLTVNNFSV